MDRIETYMNHLALVDNAVIVTCLDVVKPYHRFY